MRIGKFNRIKKTFRKRAKFWCHACDRSLVSKGTKCKECGKRNIK